MEPRSARITQKPFTPEYRDEQTGEAKHCVANTAKALEKLGFAASIQLEEGLTRTIEKY